jgi:hypothetical protein
MNSPLRMELIESKVLMPASDVEARGRLPPLSSAVPVLRLDDAARTAAATRVALAQRGIADTELEATGATSNHHRSGFDRDRVFERLQALAESRHRGV